MTTSFAIDKTGDLIVKSSKVQLVSGTDKLKQDIFTWITEAYGVDRFHPFYGSTMTSYIGQLNTLDNAFRIEIEVSRVLSNLQRYQKSLYDIEPGRFQPDELLDTVIDISAEPELDSLNLHIVFATANQETHSVDIEVN